jgi:hypothetical protein
MKKILMSVLVAGLIVVAYALPVIADGGGGPG